MKTTTRALVATALPLGLAVGVFFAAPSCSSGGGNSAGCTTNADCPSTAVCSGGKCLLNRGSGSGSGSGSNSSSSSSGSQASGSSSSSSGTSSCTGFPCGGSSSSGSSSGSSTCTGFPCGGSSSSSSGSGSVSDGCYCTTSCCSIDEANAPSGTQCPGTTKYCYGTSDAGPFYCNIQNGKCDPFDPCSGASGAYVCDGGTSSGSSSSSSGGPATVDPTGLSFVITGDTRPDSSGQSYPTTIVNQIYTDFTELSPRPLAVIATGDFQEEGDSNPTSEIGDYENAIAIFAPYGPTYPSMGNHECVSTNILTYCEVSGPNSSNNTSAFTAYMGMMSTLTSQHPTWFPTSTNGQPYYYETITAPNGDSAKFVITAANAWDSNQVAWLGTTLAIPSTFTFIARHEPDDAVGCTDSTANDNTTSNCPFIADVQTAINAATVPVTGKLEGHTHDIRFDTYNDAIVSGSGGVAIEAGCTQSDTIYCDYGFVWCQELTNKTFLCSAYDYMSTTAPVMAPASGTNPAAPMQFIMANGSPNPGTVSYPN
jgi:hypothetical protein